MVAWLLCVRRSAAALTMVAVLVSGAAAQTNTGEICRRRARRAGRRAARRHRRRRARRERHRIERRHRRTTGRYSLRRCASARTPSPRSWRGSSASSRSGVERAARADARARLRARRRRADRGGHASPRDAPLLQTANAEISDVIENREVVQLPLNGRNFLALAQLSDAVVHSARRHARRRAAAGRAAAERRRPAIGPQHLPARRRQGHRRAVQQPRHQSVGRLDPGIQDPEVAVSGGVRRQGVGADQRRDARRHERVARQPVRVPAPRRVRRAQLLRSARSAGAAAAAEPVRRRARRAASCATGRFFFVSYEGQRVRRSLTRTFSVPTAAVRARRFLRRRRRSAIR